MTSRSRDAWIASRFGAGLMLVFGVFGVLTPAVVVSAALVVTSPPNYDPPVGFGFGLILLSSFGLLVGFIVGGLSWSALWNQRSEPTWSNLVQRLKRTIAVLASINLLSASLVLLVTSRDGKLKPIVWGLLLLILSAFFLIASFRKDGQLARAEH